MSSATDRRQVDVVNLGLVIETGTLFFGLDARPGDQYKNL